MSNQYKPKDLERDHLAESRYNRINQDEGPYVIPKSDLSYV